VQLSRVQGRSTGQLLIESGAVRPDQLARALAERFGVDSIDLSVFEVDMGAVNLVGREICPRYHAAPVGFMPGGELLVKPAPVRSTKGLGTRPGNPLTRWHRVASPHSSNRTVQDLLCR